MATDLFAGHAEIKAAYGWTTRWAWRLFAVSLPVSIAAGHVTLGLLILATALRVRAGEIRWKGTPLDRFIAIYLIVCLATGILGLVPVNAFVQLASFWHISIYLLMVNTISDREEMKKILLLVFLGAMVNAAWGIVQNVTGGGIRAIGFFDHPITFGGEIQLILLLAVAVWLELPWGGERGWLGVGLLILSGGLLVSYTRSAWIGFITGVGGIGWSRGLRAWLPIVAGIGLVLVFAMMMEPALWKRIQTIPDARATGSNEERLRIWGAAIDVIKDHPIFGVGGGGFRTAMEAYRERWGLTSRSHAHNNFLQQTAEHGLLGLAAFTAIWFAVLRAAWQAWRTDLSAPYRGWLVGGAMAVAAFLTAGLFEANFGNSVTAMMIWFMVGLVMWVRAHGLPLRPIRTIEI
ncbi:MAG: O-antigen ligase family protein [Nitrospirae bacterium]|nr:O-antigen ligase family protein [Nitrospirota bacterium]